MTGYFYILSKTLRNICFYINTVNWREELFQHKNNLPPPHGYTTLFTYYFINILEVIKTKFCMLKNQIQTSSLLIINV